MKIRALALAVTLALAVPAAPAAAASASAPSAAAVHASAIRILSWRAAQYRMRRDWWCWRTVPGRFACAGFGDLELPPMVVVGSADAMLRLLRREWGCTGDIPPPRWLCTPPS